MKNRSKSLKNVFKLGVAVLWIAGCGADDAPADGTEGPATSTGATDGSVGWNTSSGSLTVGSSLSSDGIQDATGAEGWGSDVGEEEGTNTSANYDLQAAIDSFIAALEDARDRGLFVTVVESVGAQIEVVFEDSSRASVSAEAIDSYDLRDETWTATFEFVDGQSIELGFIGTLPFGSEDVQLDPYGNAPLAARLNVEMPVAGRFTVRVVGQDGEASDFVYGPSSLGSSHSLQIYGLYPDYDNTVEFVFFAEDGRVRATQSVVVTTAAPPEPFPDLELEIRVPYEEPPPRNTVFMLNLLAGYNHIYVDPYGKIRYIHAYSAIGRQGILRLRNGNLGYGVSNTGRILEFSWMGELLNEWNLNAPYVNHHDLYERANGNFLLPATEPAADSAFDIVVEIDRQTNELHTVWDLKDSLQRDRLYPDVEDWAHVNSVAEDVRDGTIVVSSQRHGVAKLTQENELVWLFTINEGWDEAFVPYMLEYDSGMQPIMGQHAASYTETGTLILFNNGSHLRDISIPPPGYSRVVEYAIEETPGGGGSITELFGWGSERPDLYSPSMGDTDYLPETDTFLMTAASLSVTGGVLVPEDPDKAAVVEVDRAGNVLFDMLVRYREEVPGAVYRAEKMLLEP